MGPVTALLFSLIGSLLLFARSIQGPVKEVKVSAGKLPTDKIGEFVQKQASLNSFKLGQAEFQQPPACVVQDARHEGRGFDGLISPAALGMRRVAIDPVRGELGFSR